MKLQSSKKYQLLDCDIKNRIYKKKDRQLHPELNSFYHIRNKRNI
jgi:hypothetical protein